MKKTLFLLLAAAGAYAQVTNPHSSSSAGAERIANFTVSDAGNDRIEIANGTQNAGRFSPTLWSYKETDNTYSLAITSAISSTVDNGTSPVMIFSTTVPQQIYPGAPGNGEFIWGPSGTSGAVAVRPLFEWRNASARLMTILANGNTGIGTTAPTARFNTNGTVRFQNIPTATTNPYVLTVDANGNVFRQLATSLGGTSIGGVRELSVSNPVLSEQLYKRNESTIQNPIEIINKLDGMSYFWNKDALTNLNLNDKQQYGFNAQQVEAVLPEIVTTSAEGAKAIDYNALVPILLEAVKNQQAQIEQLQSLLSSQLQSQNATSAILKNTLIATVSPNPSNDKAIIELNIDDQAGNVQLIIADLKGVVLSNITIKEKGTDVKRTINRDNFGAGTFIISLMVNGKNIDSKKVIFK